MATNFFVDNFNNTMEQELLEDLIIEAIQWAGQDMLYIPRVLNNYDSVYSADDQSSYTHAIPIEIYIKNIDGFQGDGNFMSKFGIEIRDQVVFSLSRRRFAEEVGTITTQPRPNEGDLIFFPLNQKCFQIKFVQKFEMYYQLGALQTWEVTAEVFEYSDEIINTGIPEIDSLQKHFDTNQWDWAILNENGLALCDENYIPNLIILEGGAIKDVVSSADNDEIHKESNNFIDFSITDPFSQGNIR